MEDVFTMLKMKVDLMEEKDKNCGLVIDEMAIQPKYEFNSTTQSFMGRPTLPAHIEADSSNIEKFTSIDLKKHLPINPEDPLVAVCVRKSISKYSAHNQD